MDKLLMQEKPAPYAPPLPKREEKKMTEHKDRSDLWSNILASFTLGFMWVVIIIAGLTIVNAFWEAGGSLTALNVWIQIWLIIGVIGIVVWLGIVTRGVFIPLREWYKAKIIKQNQRIKNIDLVKDLEEKIKDLKKKLVILKGENKRYVWIIQKSGYNE